MQMTFGKRQSMKRLAVYIVNAVLAGVFILPMLWMLSSAFKPEPRIFADLSSWKAFFPIGFTTENFRGAFERVPLLQNVGNSIFYISILLCLSLIINSLCGYALAKFHFKGKRFLLNLVIGLMVFPFDSIVIPLYTVITNMKLLDSYVALVLPFVAKCFSIFMFRQFFLDIPDELIEAAEIDGCSKLSTFFKVVIPISGPVFATVFILDFVGEWSAFLWPLIVLTNPKKYTIQLGIQAFFTASPPIYYGQIMAALTVAVFPMLILFLFFQKYYVQGIATTGLKG